MKALNFGFELVDIQSSWQSMYHTQKSTFSYLNNGNFISPVSAAFRRTGGWRKCIARPRSALPSFPSPELRRPADRLFPGNGMSSNSVLLTPTTSISIKRTKEGSVSELELFLELVPYRMRNPLVCHENIDELIEVVLDFGRKPLARFPTGDWIISQEPVKLEDLQHAISKVTN